MKLWKKISLCALPLLLIGCGNKLDANYDKMKVSKDNISGYILDLRIYGTSDSKSVNEIVRITDYNDTEYKIVKTLAPTIKDGNYVINEETTYIKDGKVYALGTDGTYAVSKTAAYKDPSIYLEGMKNTTSLDKGTKTKIGSDTYTTYKAVFKKAIVNEILKDTSLNTTVSKDISGTITIDSKGYVYRIIYSIDKLTINANYYGYDTVSAINFPTGVK